MYELVEFRNSNNNVFFLFTTHLLLLTLVDFINEADRDLERQNNFFLMMSDELVAPMMDQSIDIYGTGNDNNNNIGNNVNDNITYAVDDYDMNYVNVQHSQHEPWKM